MDVLLGGDPDKVMEAVDESLEKFRDMILQDVDGLGGVVGVVVRVDPDTGERSLGSFALMQEDLANEKDVRGIARSILSDLNEWAMRTKHLKTLN